ncbi:Alcohol dehydrogenase GroES domain protein (plasmid) [Gemmatirosa kalamazoonensis]|uniref:Alcohol dehydrogenase GroES domain protein n=1 Tax=Gemmatirosa kalamazoonensis TaxID=861299 RepID=W0RU79_9BACT|nr:alcohol dehydrogenase catalytic domain-containing protein [Gemmatirosa kalamazoonensis]AHG93143.1 Alcohol dehydrogenase GroES domain protein [Gemmatirosa kalamazoonensis]
MRAAVLVDVNRIEVRDVPRAVLAPHEVRVRVGAVGLCGTDVHIVEGHANYHRDAHGRVVPLASCPQILGHEIAGEVVEIGADARGVRVGERVIVDQGRTCVGERRTPVCEYCATGDSHQCEWYAEHGITGLPGGFAEEIVVPAANVVPLASDLDLLRAALAEPLGCVVHSTETVLRAPSRYRLAGDAAAVRTVVLCGAGPSGLLFVQYLRNVLGFDGTLLVSEPSARRRVLAERFGGETIDPTSTPLADAVRDRTEGRMAELLIDASGAGAVIAAVPELVRKQGTVLFYAHGHAGVDLSVMNGVQFLEPTMLSPCGASGGFEPDGRPTTYVRALRMIESGRIDVGSLVTHRYHSLDAVPQAFAGDHRLPEYVKGVVVL